MLTLKEISLKDFASDNNSIEHIQTGAIQRIADACELMAKNWQSLSNDVSYYKDLSARKQLKINDLEH